MPATNVDFSFSGVNMLLASQMLITKQPNIAMPNCDIGTKFATKPKFCHSTLSVILHIVSLCTHCKRKEITYYNAVKQNKFGCGNRFFVWRKFKPNKTNIIY